MSGSLPHAISSHHMMNLPSSGSSIYDERSDDETNKADLNARNAKASSDLIVTLSEEGQALSQKKQSASNTLPNNNTDPNKDEVDQTVDTLDKLSQKEQKEVDELKRRDQEVRKHEQAHTSVGAPDAGPAVFTYKQGPDGKRYVIDGEVSINVQKIEGDPNATIDKMEHVYRAALAPITPSNTDKRIAAEAQAIINAARKEITHNISQSHSEEVATEDPSLTENIDPKINKKLEAYTPFTHRDDSFSEMV